MAKVKEMFKYFLLGTLYLAYHFHWASTQTNPMTIFCSDFGVFMPSLPKPKGIVYVINLFVCLLLRLPIYLPPDIDEDKYFHP